MVAEAATSRAPAHVTRARRAAVGGCALALSVLFHAAILESFPPIRLGRADDIEQIVRFPAIQLQAVIQRMARKEQAPARFRPENPAEAAEWLGGPGEEDVSKGVDLPIPEPPEMPGAGGAADGALAEPSQPRTPDAWDPRQEIVKIDDKVLDDDEILLPRRYTDPVPRAAAAPDVVLPIEAPDATGLYEFAMGRGPGEQQVEGASSAGPRYVAVGGGAAEGAGLALPPATLLEEKPSDVTATEAVDEYLELETFVFSPPEEPGVSYFELHIKRHGSQALPVLPKDVLFLQDCSESMTAAKLVECKRGLRQWMDFLKPDDRFEIVAFREGVEPCFGSFAPRSEANVARAVSFIESLRAEGNTDVYASLEAALGSSRDPARPLVVVLVTDGRPTTGVTGTSDIIETFTLANDGRLSVFTVGGGRKVNRFLLDLLSYRNRGDSLLVPEPEEIPAAMARQGRELNRPVLADLAYHFSGIDESDVFPRGLTHLYLDRSLVIHGRATGAPDRAAFQIVGRSGEKLMDLVFPLDLKTAKPGAAEIRTRWAWHKAYHLIGRHLQLQQASLLDEIRALADDYRLNLPYGYGRGVPMW